ncbi:MAG: UvrD-helicase domain-containing protein [Simkaniaceae bacterium]
MELNVLDPNLSIEGPLFVEASAGTGKTFAIEHLVKHLVTKKAIPVKEILIVTFTKAAARELKERIRTTLAQAKEEASCREAFLSLDEATIGTIHHFCHRVLSEFAFEARASYSLINEEESSFEITLYKEVQNFFRSALTEDLISKKQLKNLFLYFSRDLRRFSESLLQNKRGEKARSYSELFPLFKQCQISNETKEQFLEAFFHYKGFCNQNKEIHQKWIDQLDALIQGNWEDLVGENSFFSLLHLDNLKKKGEPLPLELERIKNALFPLLEEARSPSKLLQLLREKLQIRLQKVKEALDLYSPDDLIIKTKEALDRPEFVEKVRSKYKAVVIDEFQDTDEMQWAIFKNLFLYEGIKAFIVVGDPKQSIYSFRGADLSVYYEAREHFLDQRYLKTNYRSSLEVIEALNFLFSKNPNWLIEGEYYPVKAGLGHFPGAGVEIVILEGALGRKRNWPTKNLEESHLFPFLVNEIVEKEYALEEVAIFVKDRYQAERLERFFLHHEIPVISKGVKPLKETMAFGFMEALFDSLKNLSHSSYIKRFLGHAFLPFSLNELADSLCELTRPLSILHYLKKELEKGAASFFKALFESSWSFDGVSFFETLSLQDYSDFMNIAELLLNERDPFSAFKSLKETSTSNAVKRRPLSSEKAVTIMTMHRSKGLEFPICFALSLASRHLSLDDSKNAAEEMRGLYVALTRAKNKVYFPIALEEKGISKTPSQSEFFLSRLISPLTIENLVQHVEKWANEAPITYRILNEAEATLFQVKENDPIQPPETLAYTHKALLMHSFTSLSKTAYGENEKKVIDEGDLPIGAETGVRLHALFEQIIAQNLLNKPKLLSIVKSYFPEHQKRVLALIKGAFTIDLVGGFNLSEVPVDKMAIELQLLYPLENGDRIKGFCDLLFEYEGRFYLLDWKSNVLDDYNLQSLEKAMIDHDYHFQGTLYSEALRRYLQKITPLPFEEVFGGVFYLFLRGLPHAQGVYYFKPNLKSDDILRRVTSA